MFSNGLDTMRPSGFFEELAVGMTSGFRSRKGPRTGDKFIMGIFSGTSTLRTRQSWRAQAGAEESDVSGLIHTDMSRLE